MKSLAKIYSLIFSDEVDMAEAQDFIKSSYYRDPLFILVNGDYEFHWGNASFVLSDERIKHSIDLTKNTITLYLKGVNFEVKIVETW